MSDAREEKESMAGRTNDGRDDQFDQGHASRVRVDVGWLLFVEHDDFRAFRVATVGFRPRVWWGELR
jgi:hypothetical protein